MKNKKLIIGITFLITVMTLILGISYAYYRTRIIGNNALTSINVTTKNLEIKYKDGNSTVNMESLIEPGFKYTKEFSVENTGDGEATYALYLEDVVNTYTRTTDWEMEITCSPNCNGTDGVVEFPQLGEMIAENTIEKGITQTYNVTINYKNQNEDQSKDMGSILSGKFQIYAPENIVDIEGTVANAEEGDYVQINSNPKKSQIVDGKYRLPAVEVGTHTLRILKQDGTEKGSTTLKIESGTKEIATDSTVTIKNTTEKFILNITKIASSLEFEFDDIEIASPWDTAKEDTLLYLLKNNQPTASNAKVITSEDDYDTSYIYQGNVTNNYGNFAGMCWRVVRVEGDGSIKLILEDRYAECNDNETSKTTEVYTGNWKDNNESDRIEFGTEPSDFGTSDYKPSLGGDLGNSFKTFQVSLATKISTMYPSKTISDILKNDEWCFDDTIVKTEEWVSEWDGIKEYHYNVYYAPSTRENPTLKCTGTKITNFKDNSNMYVGTLTVDEIIFAGSYLSNIYSKENNLSWWSLSPVKTEYQYGYVFFVDSNNGVSETETYSSGINSRPAIVLKNNVTATTNSDTTTHGQPGTLNNPYVID